MNLALRREGGNTNLELCMALVQQHVHRTQLLHVPVLFKLLTDLGADSRDRDAQGVHGLDFGGLQYKVVSAIRSHIGNDGMDSISDRTYGTGLAGII